MKALFIINPVAGGSNNVERVRHAVVDAFKHEDGLYEIKVAKEKGDAFKLSNEAVRRGYEAVIACGGDGTVHETAGPLVNTDTLLGVVPCGSGNGFARSLGIPFDVNACMELIKRRQARPIDTGVIGDRYFFSTAGMGFDAHLSRKYNDGFLSKRLRGLVPYFPLAALEFYRFKPRPLQMKMDNNLISETPFILTFANIERYGGQALIAPGAIPDDGLLDVCTVPEIGFFDALGLVKKLFNGRIAAFKGYRCIRAGNIDVRGEGESTVHADGEPFQWRGDISVKVLPKSLRVLAGQHRD